MRFVDTIASLFGHTCPDMSHYDKKIIEFALAQTKFDSPMLVGDSITEGWKTSPLMPSEVINYGISGDTTVGVLKRINQITNAMPHAIILNIGINDLGFGIDDTLPNRYEQILQQLSKECDVYCCALRPVNNFMPQGKHVLNPIIKFMNGKLQEISTKYGCQFISETFDLHFDGKSGQMFPSHTFDGLHLNQLGYEIEYNKALKPIIEQYL